MNIIVNIDVTKIQKDKLVKGKKGTYLDAVLIENKRPDEYGNHYMVVQGVTKAERDAGVRGPIIGNAKRIGGDQPRAQEPEPPPRRPLGGSQPQQYADKDIPF